MNKTALVRDKMFILHNPGFGHPERPERLTSIYSALDAAGIFSATQRVDAREATAEEICSVHAQRHYEHVISTRGEPFSFDGDTSTSEDSVEAALLAAGGTVDLVRGVASGRLANGFALVRPPGHHAERSRCMGFCIFNNVAVAAMQAVTQMGLDRVMVLDWDLHHGNGTQFIFYDDPRVLYMSTHRYPFYPGSGSFEETGDGAGDGYTVNVPLPPGMGDADYLEILRRVAVPVAARYRPQLVLVSAGYDTARGDPLGDMVVTAGGYAAMTRLMMDVADEHCAGKLVLALEGGYNTAMLSSSVLACTKTMMGETVAEKPHIRDLHPSLPGILKRVSLVHTERWGIE
jgi:acetoin utilization deacetylase AcuC-like enzyme